MVADDGFVYVSVVVVCDGDGNVCPDFGCDG
jgi:hypothetical protein